MAALRDATIGPRIEPNRRPAVVPISLETVPPLIALFDLFWIVAIGVGAGILYDFVALEVTTGATNYTGSGIVVSALFLTFAYAAQLYQKSHLLRLKWQVARAALVWIGVFVFLASMVFVLKIGAAFSRGASLLFFSSGLAFVVLTRVVLVRCCGLVISSHAFKPSDIVLIETDEITANEELSELGAYGYSIVRRIAIETSYESSISKGQLKARMQEVVRYAQDNPVDEIVLAIPWDRHEIISEIERELRVLPIPIKLVPDTLTGSLLKRPLYELGPIKAVEIQRAPLNAAQRNAKQAFDAILAGIGLVMLIPLFGVMATAIRLETPGPPLFLQTRVGFNGRPFKIVKFRTMSSLDDGPVIVQATKGDRRVTTLGRLLRKLSIDELPQLLNVVRGEMSLVGPRPHALAHDNEYDRLIATYALRRKMKPGITGWAQVNGFRGETPELGMMKRRIDSDLWYIEYWSLWLDIRILILTVVRALKSDAAY